MKRNSKIFTAIDRLRKKDEKNKIPRELSMGVHVVETAESPVNTVVRAVIAGIGIIASLLCFITAMESRGLAALASSDILIAGVMGWLWFSVLYGLHGTRPVFSERASWLSLTAILLFGIANVRKIACGFMAAVNILLGSLFAAYREIPLFDPSAVLPEASGASPEGYIPMFFGFLALMITAAACRFCVKKPGFIPFFVATFFLPEIVLYFGIVPSYGAFGLLAASWCALLAAEIVWTGVFSDEGAGGLFSKSASQSGIAAFLTMAVAFGAGAVIARDHVRSEDVDNFRTAVVVYMRSFTWQKFTEDLRDAFLPSDDPGVTHDGRLGNVDSVEFGGNIMLYVTLPEGADTLYLKGFTGTDYQGSRWAEGASLPVLETKLTSQEFFPARIMKNTPPFEGLPNSNVIVRNIGMSDSVRYFPSNAAGLLETDGKRRRYGVYFPEAGWQKEVIEVAPNVILSGETARDEAAMKAYAYSYCLDVPETFTAYEGFFDEYHGVSLYYELEYIRQGLARRCSYDLTAGKKPFGVDFAQWFMTENRRGSCTHFATAAALLCRSRGIPARYCEGYIIKAEDIRDAPVKDGYAAVSVPDSRAHAWIEVYVDNVGWIPYETTPGYGNIAFSGYSSLEGSTVTSVITEVETEPTVAMTEQLTVTSEVNPENAAGDMTEVTVTAPVETQTLTSSEVSVQEGTGSSLTEETVTADGGTGTGEVSATMSPGSGQPGSETNVPGNNDGTGEVSGTDIPDTDDIGELSPDGSLPPEGSNVSEDITGEGGGTPDENAGSVSLPQPGLPELPGQAGQPDMTGQPGEPEQSDITQTPASEDMPDSGQLRETAAAVGRVILAVITPVLCIALVIGGFLLRRRLIMSRRRELCEKDRSRAAEQIYLLLYRMARRKGVSLDNIPLDSRGAYLKEKGEPWGERAEIIISAAMAARFGGGISPGELLRAARAYEEIAAAVMESRFDRLVCKYIRCSDKYC